jgi:hypothetical protein
MNFTRFSFWVSVLTTIEKVAIRQERPLDSLKVGITRTDVSTAAAEYLERLGEDQDADTGSLEPAGEKRLLNANQFND